ncbi:hypothetical protein CBF33_00320 [Vagococcus lutrae]|nr:hypothetical protein CBF33_00320 [Vagococcus lutrae]
MRVILFLNLLREDVEGVVILDKEITRSSLFEEVPRRGVIVWVYTLRPIRQLKKFGVIQHVSRKQKYVYLYMNEWDIEKNIERLEKLHFIRSVEQSYRPDIPVTFQSVSEMFAQ